MSKYNILIESSHFGEEWLEADTFTYILFLSGKLAPSPEQVSYIKEQYDNDIGHGVTFGKYTLKTVYGKIEKEGYALYKKGPYSKYDFFHLTKYMIILDEPVQRTRVFETVIIIKFDYGRSAGNMNCAWHDDAGGGFIRINLDYNYKRRAIAKKNRHVDRTYQKEFLKSNNLYDYYDIPHDEDPLTYMPIESNFDFCDLDRKDTIDKIIVPYTPRKIEILEKLMGGSKKIGELIRELLFHIEDYETKALPDKTNLIIGGTK